LVGSQEINRQGRQGAKAPSELAENDAPNAASEGWDVEIDHESEWLA
jgi:hypothetical protein